MNMQMNMQKTGRQEVKEQKKSDWKIGFWLGLASIGAILVGAIMHMRSLMACGPLILVAYFGYLLYCLYLKSDTPREKGTREDIFDEEGEV